MSSLRVAIVGGGAVGQVYGLHLQKGGAEVTFYVREKYRAETEAGMRLIPLRGKREPITLTPDAVVTDPKDVQGFDQVWFCVPTTALIKGGLDPIFEAIQNDGSTIVNMMPGVQVRELVNAKVSADRVVDGLIGMVAYQAPLPGEDIDPPGTAFILPSLSASKFSGLDKARVEAVHGALRAGGCPAKITDDARVSLAFSSSLMMPMIVALEGAGWELAALRRGDWLSLAAGTGREAMGVIGAELDAKPPLLRFFLRRWLLSLISRVAPWIAPFDVEVYLKYHFTKVGEQTRLMIRGYIEGAKKHGLPGGHIEALEKKAFGALTSGD